MLFPRPALPFGMVKLSPDNRRWGWGAGYKYEIGTILGFSHIHSWTMSGLLSVSTTGPLKLVQGAGPARRKVSAHISGTRPRSLHPGITR